MVSYSSSGRLPLESLACQYQCRGELQRCFQTLFRLMQPSLSIQLHTILYLAISTWVPKSGSLSLSLRLFGQKSYSHAMLSAIFVSGYPSCRLCAARVTVWNQLWNLALALALARGLGIVVFLKTAFVMRCMHARTKTCAGGAVLYGCHPCIEDTKRRSYNVHYGDVATPILLLFHEEQPRDGGVRGALVVICIYGYDNRMSTRR